MQFFAIFTAFFALLAGRGRPLSSVLNRSWQNSPRHPLLTSLVLTLEIAINIGELGTIPANQFLDVSDSALQVAVRHPISLFRWQMLNSDLQLL